MLVWRYRVPSAESGDRLIDFNWTPPFLSPKTPPKKLKNVVVGNADTLSYHRTYVPWA